MRRLLALEMYREGATLAQIGEALQVTRERARQYVSEAHLVARWRRRYAESSKANTPEAFYWTERFG